MLSALAFLGRLGARRGAAGAAVAEGGVAIEVAGLVCRFGGGGEAHAALDGLDLAVPRGRVTAVVGPSGAGKSTLLRAVAGLVAPDAGDVRFDGASVLAVPPERRRLGVVFQSYALFPHLSVADNVAFPLRVRGVGRGAARRRVAEVLERLEIGRLAGRWPHQLSGGERQRVALARALAAEPRALLLDEPLAALDARLRLALRGELAARLRAAGLTCLYVTHDQEEAMALGDRVAVLRAGRLEQAGTPEALYRTPATPFVARFVGEASFLPVAWRRERRELAGPLGTWAVDAATAARFDGAPGGAERSGRLMVRPEALRPVAAERAVPGMAEAVVRGRVVTSTFLGGHRRLVVAADGAPEPLKVDLPAAAGGGAPAPGETVTLAVDLATAVLLPDFDPAALDDPDDAPQETQP
jgi:putative spermidine/putrescine transport system ATP-binding protein